ncbi:MAG: hypothetical protein JWN04_1673 [Myxococcaceae bacterium]|nr:hypothetical protein [Myxococcaceae bacterium]
MSDIRELKPARPEVSGSEPKSYMPHLPWRWLLGVGLFLTLSIGTCHIRDKQETDALRATVLHAYGDQLSPLAKRYQDIVEKVRADTAGAAARPEAQTYVDPRLKIDALGSSKGLYLRVPAEAVRQPEKIVSASADMLPDAIARCMGLAPQAVPELFTRGEFLEKDWIARADEADSVLKLRVVAEELRGRSERDLPFLAEALKAEWFLLVLERGDNRRASPVDVYLWDLRANKLLLSTRARASGSLVAARISVGGIKPGNYASGAQTGAAQDCSIASQVRALAGEAPTTFEHTPPAPREAMGIPPQVLHFVLPDGGLVDADGGVLGPDAGP